MERRLDSRETMQDETVEEDGSGHASRPLSASEPFHTRSCTRCAGLLVTE